MTTAYLNDAQAAEYLGITPRYLRRLRERGEMPVLRFGPKTLRYSPADLDAWAASKREDVRRVHPISVRSSKRAS